MPNLNEVANLDWNGDMVSPKKAVAGSGIVSQLNSVIHRIWDILEADWDKRVAGVTREGEDGEYFPTGGCCCA